MINYRKLFYILFSNKMIYWLNYIESLTRSISIIQSDFQRIALCYKFYLSYSLDRSSSSDLIMKTLLFKVNLIFLLYSLTYNKI